MLGVVSFLCEVLGVGSLILGCYRLFYCFGEVSEVVNCGLFLLLGARVLCGFVVFVDFGYFLRAGFLGFVWI